MIDLTGVSVMAGARELLRDIHLSLDAGSRAVLTGPSGSGKSTLLKVLVGGHSTFRGRVAVDGVELSSATVDQIRASVAYVGQEPVLGAPTPREALLLPFQFKVHRQLPPSSDELVAAIERLRLHADILDQPASRVSGGEKQRLVIARALLLGKRIFLADEFTSALDPESRDAAMDALGAEGHTVLSVSHDPVWTARCNERYRMDAGALTREAAA